MRIRLSGFGGLLESKILVFPDETPDVFTITLPIKKEFTNAKCSFVRVDFAGSIYEYVLSDIELIKI